MQKNIVVTGAGKGIGFEIAKKAAELGHHVFAISRNIETLKSIPNITPLSLDLSQNSVFEEILAQIGTTQIDVLINNAGLLINKSFADLTDEDWQNQWNINVMAPVRLIRTLLPRFSSTAHIVNISSMGGLQGSSKFAGLSAYSSTKGALSILTECLVEESGFKNISVNALCLGAVQTEMLEKAFPGYKAPVSASNMGDFVLNFALNSGQFMSGKIIPVAKNNPS